MTANSTTLLTNKSLTDVFCMLLFAPLDSWKVRRDTKDDRGINFQILPTVVCWLCIFYKKTHQISLSASFFTACFIYHLFRLSSLNNCNNVFLFKKSVNMFSLWKKIKCNFCLIPVSVWFTHVFI